MSFISKPARCDRKPDSVGIAAAQSIQSQLAGKIDIVVATDNSGDYSKVQDAINAVPQGTPPSIEKPNGAELTPDAPGAIVP